MRSVSGLDQGEGLVAEFGEVVEGFGIGAMGVLADHVEDGVVVVGGFLEAGLGLAQLGESGVSVVGLRVAVEEFSAQARGGLELLGLDGVEGAVAEAVDGQFDEGHGRGPR